MNFPIGPVTEFLTSLVGILSSLLGVATIAILYLITHPETVEKWQELAAKTVSSVSERGKRTAVSANIQSEINSFAKAMNSESDGAMPYGVKIEWAKEASREALIQGGEVIVRMKHHSDQPRNMVYATLAYVSKGFLPHGRHYLEEKTSKSADHIITRKMFVDRNLRDALQLYVSDFLEPELQRDATLKERSQLFEKLDQRGLMLPIFAREIEHLGLSLYPTIASSSVLAETADFVDLLRKIAEREPGEDVPGGTLFLRSNLKLAIALIARREVLLESGVGPHLLWISDCLGKGAETLYLTARGQPYANVVHQIADRLVATGNIEKLCDHLTEIRDAVGKPFPHIVTVLRKIPR
jgi:hypothetical protein